MIVNWAAMAEINLEIVADVQGLTRGVRDTQNGLNKITGESRKFKQTAGQTFDSARKKNQQFNKSLRSNEQAFSKGINQVKQLAGALGVAFSVAQIKSFADESIRLFDVQAKAEQQLLVALDNRQALQQRLIEQARELQGQTTFGDEEIIRAQSLIAAFVDQEDQIKELTKVTLDFAAAKGVDLGTAADLITKTFASETNALSRYGLQVEGAANSQDRLLSLTTALNSAFEGQAEALALVGTGTIQQQQNLIGDLREELGEKLLPLQLKWVQLQLQVTEALLETIEVLEPYGQTLSGLLDVFSKYDTQAEESEEKTSKLSKAWTGFFNIQEKISNPFKKYTFLVKLGSAALSETVDVQTTYNDLLLEQQDNLRSAGDLSEAETRRQIDLTERRIKAIITEIEAQRALAESIADRFGLTESLQSGAEKRIQGLEEALAGFKELRTELETGIYENPENFTLPPGEGESKRAKEELDALKAAAQALESQYVSLFEKFRSIDFDDELITPVAKVEKAYGETQQQLDILKEQLLKTLELQAETEKAVLESQLQSQEITRAEYNKRIQLLDEETILKRQNLEEGFLNTRNDLLKAYEADLSKALTQEQNVVEDYYDELDQLAAESDGALPGVADATGDEADEIEGILDKLVDRISEALNIPPGKLKDAISGFTQFGQTIFQSIKAGTDQALEQVEFTIQALNQQISETQRSIEVEARLKEQGLANNYDSLREQLGEEQALRDENLKKQQELIKRQNRLDSVKQVSSLVTASANIWKSFSALGPFGIGLAVAAIATMFASFAATKAKANKAVQFRKGGSGIFDGPSHENGGVTFYPGLEAEGGEAYGVLSRSATKRHGKDFMMMVDAFNSGKGIEQVLPPGVRLPDEFGKVAHKQASNSNPFRKEVDRLIQFMENQGQIIDGGDHLIIYKNGTTKKIRK